MKPYDVEQAKTEIANAMQRAVESATHGITEVAEQTMKKLDEQARAFADLPRTLPTLVTEASLFEVTEIDASKVPGGWPENETVDVSYMQATINGATFALSPSMLARRIPRKRHRVLVIFLPIEE